MERAGERVREDREGGREGERERNSPIKSYENFHVAFIFSVVSVLSVRQMLRHQVT